MNNRDLESIFNFIREHSVEDIAFFDIKDLWEEELVEITENKMKEYISKDYTVGELTPLKKMCCYKIGAGDLEIDCDASLFTMVIFRLVFPVSGTHLECQKEYNVNHQKYQLTGLNFICVGDTMNSYARTTRKYMRENYQNLPIYEEDGKYILQKYRNVSSNAWEVIILDYYNEIEKKFPVYINEFLKVVHTIGNMLPVPIGSFNVPRNVKTGDYWDKTLKGIKDEEHQFENIIGPLRSPFIPAIENIKKCREWFSNYGSWNNFVEGTFMESFLENGKPKILWENNDYQHFYETVTSSIIKRSEEIIKKTKVIVDKYNNKELLEIYFKGVDI